MAAKIGYSLILGWILASQALWGAEPPGNEDPGEKIYFDFTFNLTAQRDYPWLDGQPRPVSFYDSLAAGLFYRSRWLDLNIDFSLLNDKLYSPEESYFGGRYFAVRDARIIFHPSLPLLGLTGGEFTLTAGRGPHRDVVETPYSVFVNANPLAAVHLDLSYRGGVFFFTDRWIQLNARSRNRYADYSTPGYTPPAVGWTPYRGTWLDKGANLKIYGLNLGRWRFGFQDLIIYLNRSFDLEFFFNPLPQYFVQLINSAAGRPGATAGNDNSFMGFFADVKDEKGYAQAQILINDLNVDFLPFFSISPAIKTKVAWSLGGYRDFSFGRLGFYHGGATKYTFAATYTAEHLLSGAFEGDTGFIEVPYSIFPYEATYAPATEYTGGGRSFAIDYTRNYLGYKYGENNLAFLVDFQRMFFPRRPLEFGLYASAEWALNGAKSPANPWHENYYASQSPDRISLLGGTVEHLLRLQAALRKPLPLGFILNLDLTAGVAINAIKLVDVAPRYGGYVPVPTVPWGEPRIYVPQRGLVEPVFKLTLGFTYRLPVYSGGRWF
ncbi:MAG: hypothetical protein LBQ61_03365 [Spirochaetales bacterium]|jgi:hypothetical protein|nr:hypothetical protein [Spirochaetales bacterium]